MTAGSADINLVLSHWRTILPRSLAFSVVPLNENERKQPRDACRQFLVSGFIISGRPKMDLILEVGDDLQ